MIVAFILTSLFIGMFMSYIWTSNSILNLMIKMAFSFYTLWAAFIALGLLMPELNAGTIKLY